MAEDFFIILQWWLLLFFLGLVFLPLTSSLFKKFWDKGYGFSKILAILLTSYFIWLLGSLKVVPFNHLTAWGIVAGLGLVNLAILSKCQLSIVSGQLLKLKENWRIFLFEELLFLICLLLWSYVRGFQPNIHGLEKFMDQGFVNSILRSQYFPPKDLWLAGESINYYYFGHLVAAVLTKLSGINSAITYNLMITTLFALCFTTTFSLVSNLVFQIDNLGKKAIRVAIIAGTISALIICFASSFHTPYYVLKNGAERYWYPDATRYIGYNPDTEDKTIHEFPAYSFVVADLHGHLSDFPFVLLFLSLLFSFLIKNSKLKLLSVASYQLQVLLGLCLGAMYMTNAWDFPIYFLILALVFLWKNIKEYGWKLEAVKQTFLVSSVCFLVSILFSLPFHLNFNQIAKGIAFVNSHTPFYQLFVLWGFFWLISFSFLIFLFKKRIIRHFRPENFFEKIARFFNIKVKIFKRKPTLITVSFLDGLILIFIAIATLLIILPEIIYVKDIYIASYHRANTMFKLTYQAYVLYALSTGYIIVRILSVRRKKILLPIVYCLLTSSILIYPFFSVRSYYGLKEYQGLDGLKWLKGIYPDDYQGVVWLKENISGQPVILEAVGESYTDYARISANTGLPTVLGWPVHEWLWRGSYDQAGKRREEVRRIYEAKKIDEVKNLLTQYQVEYIFIGALERKQYEQLAEEKFETIGEKVFESGETIVYKLKMKN